MVKETEGTGVKYGIMNMSLAGGKCTTVGSLVYDCAPTFLSFS